MNNAECMPESGTIEAWTPYPMGNGNLENYALRWWSVERWPKEWMPPKVEET